MSFDDFTKNGEYVTDYCGLSMGVIWTDDNSVILQWISIFYSHIEIIYIGDIKKKRIFG